MPAALIQTRARLARIFVIAGVLALIPIFFVVKNYLQAQVAPDVTPEMQLEQALQAGKPVFVFYHSRDCIPCKEMIAVVDQVYPEFVDSVVLVDVDVNANYNYTLVGKADVHTIPTEFFYDRSGARQRVIGEMEPEELRRELQSLADGN